MKRLIFAVVALVVLAAAATPSEVAPVLEAQGFFVEAGSNADPDAVEDAVVAARFEGGALSVAVLASEPAGGATIFAENTLDEIGGTGTVFTVAPETVGWASEGDIYTNEELDTATDASLDGGSDTEVVELFVATLINEPVGAAEPGGGGGLPWGWILLFVVVAGGAFFLWRRSQSSKRSETAAIASARGEVKKRLDDVANDIIDLETEVASSEIAAVPVLYKSATEAYSKALKEYERAETPSQLMARRSGNSTASKHCSTGSRLLRSPRNRSCLNRRLLREPRHHHRRPVGRHSTHHLACRSRRTADRRVGVHRTPLRSSREF